MEYPKKKWHETTDLDDYAKLAWNSVVGGVGYDLPKWLYETNPLEFLGLNRAVGAGLDLAGYEQAGDWIGGDLPGIGDFAFGASPFDEDLKEKMRFDYDFDAKTKHPYIFGGPDEGLEKWTRLASQLAVPIAGAVKYPEAGRKVFQGLSKVFPSMKYWDDLGIMNKQLRQIKNLYKGKKTNWPKITNIWDKFLRPMYQMPTRMARHAVTPTRWLKGWDKLIDTTKSIGRVDPKAIRTAHPERAYSTAAGRNWALAGGTRGIMELMKDDNPTFQAVASEYAQPYEDRIMRMARTKDPTTLEVTVPLRYTQ